MAKFSRAHYIILANALLRAKVKLLDEEDYNAHGRQRATAAYVGLTYAMNEIASALALDNKAFDRDRFVGWVREEDDHGNT